MDDKLFGQVKAMARWVIGLGLILVLASLAALYLVITQLPDDFAGKQAIVSGITMTLSGGATSMVGAIGAAFIALATGRRNISAREAAGTDSDGDGKPG